MKLYEIEEAIRNFEFEVDEETGEILNVEALDELEMAKEKKLEGIACLIKERRAEAKAILEEVQNLRIRANKLENSADGLEGWLALILSGENFKTPRCSVTWRKSEKVDIIDPEKIPEQYTIRKIEIKPDKAEIKKAIKNGITVAGASLSQHNNMTVK